MKISASQLGHCMAKTPLQNTINFYFWDMVFWLWHSVRIHLDSFFLFTVLITLTTLTRFIFICFLFAHFIHRFMVRCPRSQTFICIKIHWIWWFRAPQGTIGERTKIINRGNTRSVTRYICKYNKTIFSLNSTYFWIQSKTSHVDHFLDSFADYFTL